MKSIIIIIISLFIASLTLAQKGDIKGRIIDKNTKQPLESANVMVMGTDLGAATDENGIFYIKGVSEEVYKLKVNYVGYNEHIESDIRVIRGKTFYTKEIELTESAIMNEEVIVTAGHFNDFKDMPVSNYSYTKEEIARAPGAAGDIFRAIESLPGISSSGGEFSAFSVRGGAPSDNIIMIDNIPFSSVSHFMEASGSEDIHGGRFSIFTSGLIEKANFQAGGFSSKFGGKKASFLDLTIKEGNKASFTANGTYDLFGWEVNYDGPSYFDENTSFIFSARGQDLGTIFKMMDMEGEGVPSFGDYIFKLSSDINRSNKLSLLGVYSTEKSLRNLSHIYKGEAFDDLEVRNETEDKTLIGLNWRLLTNKKSYLNTSVYYSRIDQLQKAGKAYVDKINGIRPSKNEAFVRNNISIYDADEQQAGIKSDFTYNVSKNYSFNAGINLQRYKRKSKIHFNEKDTLFVFDSHEVVAGGNKFIIMDPAEVNTSFNKSRMELAAYTEASFSPIPELNINAGFRYEYDDLSEDQNISPRLSGSYKVNPATSVNFAAGIYYQLPTMQMMAFDSRNINVKNEKSYHYILGVTRYLSDAMKLTAEAYYKKLDDLIVRPSTANNFAINSGEGYSYGFDVSLLRRFVDDFYGQVNYSYGVCKVKDNPNDSYYNYDFNQPHIFNILAGYQINKNWSLSAKWKFATGRPRDNFIIHKDVLANSNKLRYSKELTTNNTLRYDAFHSMNVRVDYRTQFSERFALTAYVEILNLYNRKNQYVDSFRETTGVNQFEGLEMLPTLGFKLEL